MSTVVQEWQVRAWADNVHHLAQEMTQKLAGTTREETKVAERIGFDRLAPMEGETPSSRFAPTPNVDSEESRRWVFPRPWRFGKLTDDLDKVRTLHMPENEYAIGGSSALNREKDKRLYTAARGSATQGEESITTVALPSAQKIAHGSTGLTKSKIIQTRTRLLTAAGGDLGPYGPVTFYYHPDDLLFLLSDQTLTNTEFVAFQNLMSGMAQPGLLGFNWVCGTQHVTDSGNIRYDIAYCRMAMGMGRNRAMRKERFDERSDKSYALQVFMEDHFDYVRVDDELVVEIACDTTATPS
jgi:Phage capsid protein